MMTRPPIVLARWVFYKYRAALKIVSIAFVATFTIGACHSVPTLSSGFSSLPKSGNEDVLELRRAFVGTVEECKDCVLLEILEGDVRPAYFVGLEPDCRFELAQIETDDIEQSGDIVSLTFRWPSYIHERVKDCLGVVPNVALYEVLATVNGEFLGAGVFLKQIPSLTLQGGIRLGRLATQDAGVSI